MYMCPYYSSLMRKWVVSWGFCDLIGSGAGEFFYLLPQSRAVHQLPSIVNFNDTVNSSKTFSERIEILRRLSFFPLQAIWLCNWSKLSRPHVDWGLSLRLSKHPWWRPRQFQLYEVHGAKVLSLLLDTTELLCKEASSVFITFYFINVLVQCTI